MTTAAAKDSAYHSIAVLYHVLYVGDDAHASNVDIGYLQAAHLQLAEDFAAANADLQDIPNAGDYNFRTEVGATTLCLEPFACDMADERNVRRTLVKSWAPTERVFDRCFSLSPPAPDHLNVYIVPAPSSTGLQSGHSGMRRSVWLNYRWLDGLNAFNPSPGCGPVLFPEESNLRLGVLTHEAGFLLGLPSAWDVDRECLGNTNTVATSNVNETVLSDVPRTTRPNYIATIDTALPPTEAVANDLYDLDQQFLTQHPLLPASQGPPFSCGVPTQFTNFMDTNFFHRVMFTAAQTRVMDARARTLFPALPPPTSSPLYSSSSSSSSSGNMWCAPQANDDNTNEEGQQEEAKADPAPLFASTAATETTNLYYLVEARRPELFQVDVDCECGHKCACGEQCQRCGRDCWCGCRCECGRLRQSSSSSSSCNPKRRRRHSSSDDDDNNECCESQRELPLAAPSIVGAEAAEVVAKCGNDDAAAYSSSSSFSYDESGSGGDSYDDACSTDEPDETTCGVINDSYAHDTHTHSSYSSSPPNCCTCGRVYTHCTHCTSSSSDFQQWNAVPRSLTGNSLNFASFTTDTAVAEPLQIELVSSRAALGASGQVGAGDVVNVRRASDDRYLGTNNVVTNDQVVWQTAKFAWVVEAASFSSSPGINSESLCRLRQYNAGGEYLSTAIDVTTPSTSNAILNDAVSTQFFFFCPVDAAGVAAAPTAERPRPRALNAPRPLLGANAGEGVAVNSYTLTVADTFVLPSDASQTTVIDQPSTAVTGSLSALPTGNHVLVTSSENAAGSADLSFRLVFGEAVPPSSTVANRLVFGSGVSGAKTQYDLALGDALSGSSVCRIAADDGRMLLLNDDGGGGSSSWVSEAPLASQFLVEPVRPAPGQPIPAVGTSVLMGDTIRLSLVNAATTTYVGLGSRDFPLPAAGFTLEPQPRQSFLRLTTVESELAAFRVGESGTQARRSNYLQTTERYLLRHRPTGKVVGRQGAPPVKDALQLVAQDSAFAWQFDVRGSVADRVPPFADDLQGSVFDQSLVWLVNHDERGVARVPNLEGGDDFVTSREGLGDVLRLESAAADSGAANSAPLTLTTPVRIVRPASPNEDAVSGDQQMVVVDGPVGTPIVVLVALTDGGDGLEWEWVRAENAARDVAAENFPILNNLPIHADTRIAIGSVADNRTFASTLNGFEFVVREDAPQAASALCLRRVSPTTIPTTTTTPPLVDGEGVHLCNGIGQELGTNSSSSSSVLEWVSPGSELGLVFVLEHKTANLNAAATIVAEDRVRLRVSGSVDRFLVNSSPTTGLAILSSEDASFGLRLSESADLGPLVLVDAIELPAPDPTPTPAPTTTSTPEPTGTPSPEAAAAALVGPAAAAAAVANHNGGSGDKSLDTWKIVLIVVVSIIVLIAIIFLAIKLRKYAKKRQAAKDAKNAN